MKKNLTLDTNATSSAFGWDFQSNAAILMALKNIKELTSLKVEGDIEDIEIFLKDNKCIYLQAKSQKDPTPGNNTYTKLRDGLKTLINASNLAKYENLIYITNIKNPLKEKELDYYWGNDYIIYNYSELSDEAQKIVDRYIKAATEKYQLDVSKFNTNQLKLCAFPFFGENDETRYRIVRASVKKFINEAQVSDGLVDDLLSYWQNIFFQNSTKKKVNLDKEELVWPLVVLSASVSMDSPFFEDYDHGQIMEIKKKYGHYINKKSEQFEFVTRVSTDYRTFLKENKGLKGKKASQTFIDTQWSSYLSIVENKMVEPDINEGIIKLVLFQVLNNRFSIENVKKAANL
ncbi:hypothetical protein [Salinicoccus roseus]|uniref:hypothetical protein n=1 Tax=Salinicoccus roseus TaxID=45670 RepID=UPI003DA0486E